MPIRKCRICGKRFYAKPSHIVKGWGKYCSQKCQYKSYETGKFVICATCGKRVYRAKHDLRHSKSKKYFCNKSCQCAWKNRKRKNGKALKSVKTFSWRSWCNSSTTRCGRVREDANSSGLPLTFSFSRLLKLKKRVNSSFLKRPLKKILYNFYWRKNYTQSEIAKIFNATHTSVKRWFDYYKIPVKSRTLCCGRNPNSVKNLELGKTPEAERKSAEARRIYTKEKLIEKIKIFVGRCGRIPMKNEFIKSRNSFYPNHTSFRDYFGTWNNAIKAAGYEPNEQWFAIARNLFAKDGHKCYSISEIIIDDWLFENHIPHVRERLYPIGRYRCDFVVNNIFIEFFGLSKGLGISPDYREIIKRKKEICEKHNIQLIELYQKDLYNLNQTFSEKLGLKF